MRHFTFPDILVTLLAVASWILVTLMAWAIFATSRSKECPVSHNNLLSTKPPTMLATNLVHDPSLKDGAHRG